MDGANFEGVNLSGKHMRESSFIGANFKGANLSGGDRSKSNFQNADFNNTNLRGANLQNSDLNSSTLALAFLDRMWFNSSTKWPEGFDYLNSGAWGPGIDFRALDVSTFNSYRNNMDGANFEGVNLSGKHMRESSFIGANFKGANLSGGDRSKSNFQNADFRNANLSGANLTGSTFTGAIYNESTIWPDAFDPVGAGAISRNNPKDLNSTVVLAFHENQPIGTIIGEFNATDPDGDAITYHFVNGENNNSLFTLDTNGTLKTATTFDYESNASSYTITVQAKDDFNSSTKGNFSVYLINEIEDLDGDGIENHIDTDIDGDGVSNINEILYQTNPWDVNSSNLPPFNLRILEPLSLYLNEPAGQIVGTVRANDAEGNHTIRYSMLPIFPGFAQNDESLIVWMDASKPTQIEEVNGKVKKWKNKQVGSSDFITNPNFSNPTYGKRTCNGWKVIDFNGNAMLRSDGNLTLGENFEIFMFAGIDEIDSKVDSIFSSFVTGSSSNFYFRSLDENGFLGRFNTSTMGKMKTFLNEPIVGTALFHLQFDYNEKALRFRLDGINQGKTDYTTPPDPNNEFRIFTQSSGQTGFTKGFVGELLIFNNLVGDGQRRLMESYLGTKWNLPVVDPLPNEFFETTHDGIIKTTKIFTDINDFNQTLLIRAIDDHNLSVEKEFSVELLTVKETPVDKNETIESIDDHNQTTVDLNTSIPSTPINSINRPIPQTFPVEFLSNGNYRFGGKILTDGGALVYETGIILSKKIFLTDPIILICKLNPKTMQFEALHGDLEPGTTYYFRSYAINRVGMTRGGLKKLTTPQNINPESWHASANSLPGGWRKLDWLGVFRPTKHEWIYHAELGWLYPSGTLDGGLWLWNRKDGWKWTQDGVYPYFFRWNDSKWIYFYRRINGIPRFYNSSSRNLE